MLTIEAHDAAAAPLAAEDFPIAHTAQLVRGNKQESRQAQAAFQRGLALHARGRPVHALDAYRSAVKLAPTNPEYLRRLAVLLTGQGSLREALPLWRQLMQLRPDDPGIRAGLASVLIDQGQSREALRLLSETAERHPDDASLVHLTGLALVKLGLHDPAIGAFYHALALSPSAANHAALAKALLAVGQVDAAATHAQAAFVAAPEPALAATFTCALIEQGRFVQALAVADHAVAAGQASAEVMINRSIALEGLGHAEDAVTAARAAVSMNRSAIVEHHLAALLLTQGQLTTEAWTLYEARLELRVSGRWPDRALKWEGQDIRGKTLVLHAEQGLGDTLQFVRYVPLVAAHGAAVVLVVQPTLKRLLAGTPGVSGLFAIGETLPQFDYFSPLLSLPWLFETTLASIPPPIPYRSAPRPSRPGGPVRVGLAWAGSSTFVEDRKRSMPAELLAGAAAMPGVELLSLQLGCPSLPAGVADLVGGVADMADTAARVAELDLVISVDTAVAHLAATMGKPVWLLSRFRGCWRWLEARADSPWYPSMTIYRQPTPGDWATLLERLRSDLQDLVHQMHAGHGYG